MKHPGCVFYVLGEAIEVSSDDEPLSTTYNSTIPIRDDKRRIPTSADTSRIRLPSQSAKSTPVAERLKPSTSGLKQTINTQSTSNNHLRSPAKITLGSNDSSQIARNKSPKSCQHGSPTLPSISEDSGTKRLLELDSSEEEFDALLEAVSKRRKSNIKNRS